MSVTLGTSGISATSTSPAVADEAPFVAEIPAFAAGYVDSGPGVAHAAMPKKVAAIKFRRFMIPPRVNSSTS